MGNGESSYRRFLNNEQDAFDEIVELYFDNLVLFLNRYLNDIYAAEDIAIDSFAYILANKYKYNFKVSFKTYLFMIGKSRALNYIKHKKRINITSYEENENTLCDLRSLEETVIDKQEKELLYKALESLPDSMKPVLHLVYFENMTYAQAAKVLGKKEKQIDNLIYRAKTILREKLGKEGEMLL